MEICESVGKEAQSLQILLITSLPATYLYVSYKISDVSKQRCISQVNSFSAKGEQQKLYMLLTCCVRQHTRQSHLISPPTKQNNLKALLLLPNPHIHQNLNHILQKHQELLHLQNYYQNQYFISPKNIKFAQLQMKTINPVLAKFIK